MTAPQIVAVIDIGKTNVKVALVETKGWSEVAIRKTPNLVLGNGPYPHFDTEAIWQFLLASLRDLNAQHPVGAVAVTAHGATAALLDGVGQLALPVLDYEFDGPNEIHAAYDQIRPDFSETGSPGLPGGLNVGAQLFWQQSRFPKAFARTETILTYPQYWTFRLSGVAAMEITSLGCHTDLWCPGSAAFSSLVKTYGWADKMAPLRPAFSVLGPVLPDIAAETGLSPETPVYCGIHDSNASLLPHVLRKERPISVVSTGTWVIVMALGVPLSGLDPTRDMLINVDAFGQPVPTARFMGGREYEKLSGGDPATPTPNDRLLAARSDVFVLPADADHKARWSASPKNLPAGARTAIVSKYLAMETAKRLKKIGAAGATYVEGPFGNNADFKTHLETLTKRPVLTGPAMSTGTSVGAAMLTSVSTN